MFGHRLVIDCINWSLIEIDKVAGRNENLPFGVLAFGSSCSSSSASR